MEHEDEKAEMQKQILELQMEVRNSKMGGRKPTLSNKTTPNRTPTLLGAGANTTGMDLQ